MFVDKFKERLHNDPRYALSNIDKVYWTMYFILFACAVIALFSASSTLVYKSGSALAPVGKQGLFLLAGAFGAWLIQFSTIKKLSKYSHWALYILIVMLYLMIIPHSPFVKSINGAGRWFNLFGASFQPSEFAKVALVMVVADHLGHANTPEEMDKQFKYTLIVSIITIFPIFLGNLSTALLMGGIVVLLWILARVPWLRIIATISVAAAFLVCGYLIVDYGYVKQGKELPSLFQRASVWVTRIDNLVEEKQSDGAITAEDVQKNYQRNLAKVAVARGGKTLLFGVGPGRSQTRDHLPLAYADYIFAIIVEETGIAGAVFLIFIYLVILFRASLVSSKFGDVHPMLLTMGLALMLTLQAFISMAVAVGLGPVTGQPLPMITMGGTSSLATAFYFGVMMAVSREQNQQANRRNEVRAESFNDVPKLD